MKFHAKLDAYYARLYGLTHDELRYILDPKEVHSEDFPGETFRVLKEKEEMSFGEYRTRRLKRIAGYVGQVVAIGQKELDRASELEKLGFSGFDAVHLACAESGKADIFLSTDDRLLKRVKRFAKKIHVKVANPLKGTI